VDAFLEKVFHLTWDVDRVPYCFHRKFLRPLIAFVKKIDAWPVVTTQRAIAQAGGDKSANWHIFLASLQIDPCWDPVPNDPRFQKLAASEALI
jgi:hypothetical protein